MSRIRIEDLPVGENLSPEERERLFGAGRGSFRPTIETLEGREMYAANLSSALSPALLASAQTARGGVLVGQPTLVNEIQVTGPAAASRGLQSGMHAAPSPALDAALWGASSVTSAEAPASKAQTA